MSDYTGEYREYDQADALEASKDIMPFGCKHLENDVACEMPVEVVSVRVHHSSGPSGHAIVTKFRCVLGHQWYDVGPPDEVVIDDGGAFA